VGATTCAGAGTGTVLGGTVVAGASDVDVVVDVGAGRRRVVVGRATVVAAATVERGAALVSRLPWPLEHPARARATTAASTSGVGRLRLRIGWCTASLTSERVAAGQR
jgi:hypothetical protein